MALRTHINPAWASGASFHFQKLNINLPFAYSEVFASDTSVHTSPENWGYVLHEVTHYLQGVSTVLGQRILLNWMATVLGAAKQLLGIEPLPVPMNHPDAQQTPGVYNAVRDICDYLTEVAALVGAGHQLRPESEAKPQAEYALYDYEFPHPRDSQPTKSVALRLADEKGSAFGVPILGDALTEGMAQAVQWMASGTELSEEVLSSRPCDPIPRDEAFDIYYTAVVRAVRRRLPAWDPLLTTIVICDVALCSRYPGATLSYLIERLEKGKAPSNLAGYKDVRRELDKLAVMRQSRAYILDEIERARDGLPVTSEGLPPLFHHLFALFVRAWKLREEDPAILVDLSYDEHFLAGVVAKLGAPPIYFTDKVHFVSIGNDGELVRACHLMQACYEILLGLCIDGLSQQCYAFEGTICPHKKTEECKLDVLGIPIVPGQSTCQVAFASHELCLHGRKRLFVVGG